MNFENKGHLACAYKIGMESCEAANKPDSYEAVNYEKICNDIMYYGSPSIPMFLNDNDPSKSENI